MPTRVEIQARAYVVVEGVPSPESNVGPPGPAGPAGADGADGTNGTDGTDGISFVWRSAWSAATAYVANEVVSRNGSAYIALASTTAEAPESTPAKWSLMSQKGDTGADGADGINGTNGTHGADGLSFTWRGAWSSGTAYVARDVVSRSGSAYIALLPGTGHWPTLEPTYWQKMVDQGGPGPAGADAPIGYGGLYRRNNTSSVTIYDGSLAGTGNSWSDMVSYGSVTADGSSARIYLDPTYFGASSGVFQCTWQATIYFAQPTVSVEGLLVFDGNEVDQSAAQLNFYMTNPEGQQYSIGGTALINASSSAYLELQFRGVGNGTDVNAEIRHAQVVVTQVG